ncbi:hypothetical protein EDB85DRAFT_645596 [Lactarius pseudohatsudake]|nr:hypothetical protein EDB85DRAFT_645596 [Lactarius pseudohatsudake]
MEPARPRGRGCRAPRARPFRANGKGGVACRVSLRAPFLRVQGRRGRRGKGRGRWRRGVPRAPSRAYGVARPRGKGVGPGVAYPCVPHSRAYTAARAKGEGERLGTTGRGGSVSLTPLPARTGRHGQGGREAPGVACPQGGAVKGEGEGGGVPLTSCAPLPREWGANGGGRTQEAGRRRQALCAAEVGGGGQWGRGRRLASPFRRGKEGKGREGGEKEEGF